MATYQKLVYDDGTANGVKVQVQSAIEDEDGLGIKQYYAKKTEAATPGLLFTEIEIETTDWESSNDFPGFPYRADITHEDITASMYASVTFSNADAMTGNYAPSCQTHAGGVYVYSKTTMAITIPSIAINMTYEMARQAYNAGTDLRPLKVVNGQLVQVLNDLVSTVGDQTIADTKTFTSTIVGDISGNAATATSATSAISATSATYLGSSSNSVGSDTKPIKLVNGQAVAVTSDLALNSAVVHNTGNETIAGSKTFSSTIVGNITGSCSNSDMVDAYHANALLVSRRILNCGQGNGHYGNSGGDSASYSDAGSTVWQTEICNAAETRAYAVYRLLKTSGTFANASSNAGTNNVSSGYILFPTANNECLAIQWSAAGNNNGDLGETWRIYWPLSFKDTYYNVVASTLRLNNSTSSKSGYNTAFFKKEAAYATFYTGLGNWDQQGIMAIAIGLVSMAL